MADPEELFTFRLLPPRPTFADDMIEPESPWGLCVVRADDGDAVVAMAEGDPAVSSGTCTYAVGTMPRAYLAPREVMTSHILRFDVHLDAGTRTKADTLAPAIATSLGLDEWSVDEGDDGWIFIATETVDGGAAALTDVLCRAQRLSHARQVSGPHERAGGWELEAFAGPQLGSPDPV